MSLLNDRLRVTCAVFAFPTKKIKERDTCRCVFDNKINVNKNKHALLREKGRDIRIFATEKLLFAMLFAFLRSDHNTYVDIAGIIQEPRTNLQRGFIQFTLIIFQ